MKVFLLAVLMMIATLVSAQEANTPQPDYNSQLLPSPFPVYVTGNNEVINHKIIGSEQRMLPTDNSYKTSPGCYIACYSHSSGIYSVSDTINVLGQIRVPGEYEDRVCQPTKYKGQDISKLKEYAELCASKIPGCGDGKCWAGGDTGGWFGIQ